MPSEAVPARSPAATLPGKRRAEPVSPHRPVRYFYHPGMRQLGGFLLVMTVALLGLPGAAHAQDGLYLGLDAGGSLARSFASTRTNNGVPTNCDQWLEPATLNDGTMVPLPLAECAPRALPASPNEFDLGAGLFGGARVGYALGRLRLEAEFFQRRQSGETRDLVVPGDPKQAEFVQRTEEIGNFRANNFFANLLLDAGGGSGLLRPHLGAGVGAIRVSMDYSALSVRTDDRDALLELGRNPNAAGTRSVGEAALRDTLWGYQFVAGLDFAPVGGRAALTVRVRFLDTFGDFEAPGNSWNPLRDHESSSGPEGEPITYDIGATGLGHWAATVGVRFQLN